MAYDERNLCETARGSRKTHQAPLSPRMQAILLRLIKASPPILYVGPGHDFQTCVSLRNRGDVQGRIYGEAPKECIRVELTADGRAKALKLRDQEQLVKVVVEPEPPSLWPFPFSSRGYHLKTARAGTE